MSPETTLVLTLNAGSSSIKFALYAAADEPREEVTGQVDALGDEAALTLTPKGAEKTRTELGPTDHAAAVEAILGALAPHMAGRAIAGVGHRVVHGGPDLDAPVRFDAAMMARLEDLVPLAPLHQPHNLAAIRAARAAFPDAVQVAAFDTAFHRGKPWVADTYALPRDYYARGIRRYGFHGLSYDYIAGVLAREYPDLARARVVVAHLGNGASLCALSEGRSIATSMGFTALDGLAMGTRPGRIDPGVLLHLMQEDGMGAAALTRLLYHESGLKGLSGISHDMRDLLASEAPEAAEAIDYYVYTLAREIAAMTASLGGLDALVFTGGIGENAAPIRARALERLGFLGLAIDPAANAENAAEIHAGACPVLVIPTDEERIIARATVKELAP